MSHGIAAWTVVGSLAGWTTGKLMRGEGFGAFVDVVAGVAGAVFGGIVSRHMGLGFGRRGLAAGLAMAIAGAIVLTWIVRLFSRDRRAASH